MNAMKATDADIGRFEMPHGFETTVTKLAKNITESFGKEPYAIPTARELILSGLAQDFDKAYRFLLRLEAAIQEFIVLADEDLTMYRDCASFAELKTVHTILLEHLWPYVSAGHSCQCATDQPFQRSKIACLHACEARA